MAQAHHAFDVLIQIVSGVVIPSHLRSALPTQNSSKSNKHNYLHMRRWKEMQRAGTKRRLLAVSTARRSKWPVSASVSQNMSSRRLSSIKYLLP